MMGKLRLCTVSLFWLIVVVNSACDSRDTGCQTNNNDYANDTEVYPTAVLNCNFAGSLCCYRQGCVDDDMERWKANLGYASVRQHSTGCGPSVYSILESPLVNFSTPSCVEFTYETVNLPYQLHVFLAFNNGTLPSSKYNFTEANTNENRTSRFDVKCLTGKIQFRAKGGGANANIALPKLYHVRIIDGSCANLDQATSAPTHTASTSEQASSINSEEVSDPTTCDLVTTAPPRTENTPRGSFPSSSSSSSFSSAVSFSPQYRVTDGTTSGRNISEESSADMSTGSLVAIVVSVILVVMVVIIVALLAKKRRRKQTERKMRGYGSDGARQRAVYENQGFHCPPVVHPVEDSSVVNAREMSDHRDPSRASDASNEYITPMNVYDGLGNRNIEENPYNALANQNSTYEGLSPNRNETRLYDSLVASGGQSEDYEIPDTTGLNKERVTEVNRDSDEYYNQASSKMTGNSSLSQDVPPSKVSEYQNG